MSNDCFSKLEQIAKIVSTVAVPVIIGTVGWLVQTEISDKGVRRDYVQIAAHILSKPADSSHNQALRAWAVRLLNDNSPTKFSGTEINALETGKALLPQLPPPPADIVVPRAPNFQQRMLDFLSEKPQQQTKPSDN